MLVKITDRNRAEYQSRVAELEAIADYPLGSDRFKLDHGRDYFAFFERLGRMYYFAWVEGKPEPQGPPKADRCGEKSNVVSVAAGVIRKIDGRKTWYLCDLKVHPSGRGKHLPLKMMARAFLPHYFYCQRGYGISMNPSDGRPNRVARILSHWWLTPISLAPDLQLFSLSAEEMRGFQPALEKHRGALSYLSLEGKKDLVLASTGKRLPLMHVQFGPCAEKGEPTPREGHTHMFCAPLGDSLVAEAAAAGFKPSATATILQHGMSRWKWDFVLTSDI